MHKRKKVQRSTELRAGHEILRKEDRKVRIGRTGKTLTIKGIKPEEFVQRAMRLRIGSGRQLKEFSGLSHYRIRQIKRGLVERKLLPEKAWRERRIEALLLQGEMSLKEISIETKAGMSMVKTIRGNLKKEGKPTRLKGTREAVMKAIRALITYEALRRITGKTGVSLDRIARMESKIFSSEKWYFRNPHIIEDAVMLAGGIYWDRAMEQLLEGKGKAKLRGKKAKKAFLRIKIKALVTRRDRLHEEREILRSRGGPAEKMLELKEKIKEIRGLLTKAEIELHALSRA